MVEWLFLAVPWGCLRFAIVVFSDHTHLLFFSTHTDSIKALFKKTVGSLNVSLFLGMQLKSYKIEIVHYRGRSSNQEISFLRDGENCSSFILIHIT